MIAPDDYAVSRAFLVPDSDFTGTVHSVFANCCNVVAGDLLITVQDAAHQHTPTSVQVDVIGPARWMPNVLRGEPVSQRAGVLAFGSHVLDLRRAAVWTPEACGGWRQPQTGRRRLALVESTRRSHGASGCRGPAPAIERDVRALVAVLGGPRSAETGAAASPGRSEPDCAGLDAAVRRLVGAGVGLTPAGDDILVGLLAALSVGGNGDLSTGPAFSAVSRAVLRHASRTNDISAHYLRLAAFGRFGEALSALRAAIVADVGDGVLVARAKDVLSVGATSGADALLGLLLGLHTVLDISNQRIHKKVVA